uniref:G_PROTEIN_RECEP_F1_2 domain-containing protein n=1 Tax=Globodera pallida TaxID=36090 RepID=A0A183BU01_GLOPA
MNSPKIVTWGEYFSSSLYFFVPIIGVCLNIYVLHKLRKISRSNTFRFETSSALPLWAMSVGDSICLTALFSQALFHFIVKFHQNNQLQMVPVGAVALASILCKLFLYAMHATSAFSVWCWLLLSILRYTAVFHPLRYIRIWRQPRNALLLMAFSCCVLELWIPSVVIYQPDFASCYEDISIDLQLKQSAHLLDILFFYVIPTAARIFLDGIVLCYCYLPNVQEVPVTQRRYGISAPSSVPASATLLMEQSNRKQRPKQSIIYQHPEIFRRKKSMIKRSLIISAVNLCCNLPAHALRTIWTLDSAEEMIPERYLLVLEAISQLLYFAQFTCNALYLTLLALFLLHRMA